MRVRLIITDLNSRVYVKDYPLAVDEDEARSMMFRDHSDLILKAYLGSGRVQFNVERILDTSK